MSERKKRRHRLGGPSSQNVALGQRELIVRTAAQRRRNHPGDFPFFSSRRSTQTTPPNRNSTISFFSLPVTSKATSFTEKRQVADDHHVAAVLFERFFRSGNVVLLPSTANIARLNRGDRDCSVGWRSRPSAWRCPSACRLITSALAILVEG